MKQLGKNMLTTLDKMSKLKSLENKNQAQHNDTHDNLENYHGI